MRSNKTILRGIIREELTKGDVNSMIDSKISSKMSSRDFKKAVKELSAEVVSELFKILWQRDNFWKSTVSR